MECIDRFLCNGTHLVCMLPKQFGFDCSSNSIHQNRQDSPRLHLKKISRFGYERAPINSIKIYIFTANPFRCNASASCALEFVIFAATIWTSLFVTSIGTIQISVAHKVAKQKKNRFFTIFVNIVEYSNMLVHHLLRNTFSV